MAENANAHLVGQESAPSTIHVDRSRIRQFAQAVGATDPACYDEAEAKKRGYPSLIGPPTLVVALGQDVEPGGGGMPRLKWNVAKLLHDRGVLYAPDYVVNAGGVIQVADEIHGFDMERARAKAAGIFDTTLRIFEQADRDGVPPSEAADRLAEQRMQLG